MRMLICTTRTRTARSGACTRRQRTASISIAVTISTCCILQKATVRSSIHVRRTNTDNIVTFRDVSNIGTAAVMPMTPFVSFADKQTMYNVCCDTARADIVDTLDRWSSSAGPFQWQPWPGCDERCTHVIMVVHQRLN